MRNEFRFVLVITIIFVAWLIINATINRPRSYQMPIEGSLLYELVNLEEAKENQ